MNLCALVSYTAGKCRRSLVLGKARKSLHREVVGDGCPTADEKHGPVRMGSNDAENSRFHHLVILRV